MQVFVSLPMRGKTEEEILSEIERVKRKLEQKFKHEEIEIVDSYLPNYNPVEKHPGLKFLSKSLLYLDKADLAYFVKGFRQARGCLIEYEAAESYGIENIIVEENEEE